MRDVLPRCESRSTVWPTPKAPAARSRVRALPDFVKTPCLSSPQQIFCAAETWGRGKPHRRNFFQAIAGHQRELVLACLPLAIYLTIGLTAVRSGDFAQLRSRGHHKQPKSARRDPIRWSHHKSKDRGNASHRRLWQPALEGLAAGDSPALPNRPTNMDAALDLSGHKASGLRLPARPTTCSLDERPA